MNDAAAIDEAHRDWLEVRRYPRGNRLTITPMKAGNIRYEQKRVSDTPFAPVKPPPIKATAKDLAEMNEPPYEIWRLVPRCSLTNRKGDKQK